MIVAVIATVCHLALAPADAPEGATPSQKEICEEAAIDNGGAYGSCPTMPLVVGWLTDTFGPGYTLKGYACFPGGRPLPGKA